MSASKDVAAPYWVEIPFHWNPSQPVEPLRQGKLHLHADGSWKQTLPVGSNPELSLLSRWAIATSQEGTRAFLRGGDGPAREQAKLGIGAYRQGLLPASIGMQMEFALSQRFDRLRRIPVKGDFHPVGSSHVF